MHAVSIQDAQTKLAALIQGLAPGEEVVITENDQPVAKLARAEPSDQWPCKAGKRQGHGSLDGAGLRSAA